VLYGTDGSNDPLAARKGWAAFRQIPLADAELRAIADNVTPYMRWAKER
jgi:hypothetical protein